MSCRQCYLNDSVPTEHDTFFFPPERQWVPVLTVLPLCITTCDRNLLVLFIIHSSLFLLQEESIVCNATAQFEDFIVQFLDRLFVLVESSILESTRLEREQENRSTMESLAEGAIDSITKTLLDQTSTQIFKVSV
jgi:hypothetical protein